MRRITFLLVFWIRSTSLFGQDSLPKPMVFLAPQYGFIMPHTSQMEHLIRGHSFGFFGQLLYPTSGKSEWARAFHLPEHGVDLYLNNSGNPSQLGIHCALSYLLNLPLNRRKNEPNCSSYRHWLGIGLGAGFSTKKWDLEDNHQAAVLGSKLNTAIILQYSNRIFASNSFQLRAGLRITHFSNGAFQVPNLGTNNASIFLGFIPSGKRNDFAQNKFIEPQIPDQRLVQTVAISIGLKEIPPPTGRKFAAITASYLAEYRSSYKISFGAGFDGFSNSSVRKLMERRDTTTYEMFDAMQAGFIAGLGIHFGQFEFKIQHGTYLRDRWKENGIFYHRFGLRYRLDDHLFINFMLKTHFAKADHGEWGIGYRF